eukprot:GHRQ01000177.1.p1 GENE.GHRQ01000177.1~~GHRQ01000177.1.p1  ORF type:complete len:153 (-),score=16.57 GHRQ01000177.1:594-1052(-)
MTEWAESMTAYAATNSELKSAATVVNVQQQPSSIPSQRTAAAFGTHATQPCIDNLNRPTIFPLSQCTPTSASQSVEAVSTRQLVQCWTQAQHNVISGTAWLRKPANLQDKLSCRNDRSAGLASWQDRRELVAGRHAQALEQETALLDRALAG